MVKIDNIDNVDNNIDNLDNIDNIDNLYFKIDNINIYKFLDMNESGMSSRTNRVHLHTDIKWPARFHEILSIGF